MSDAQALSEVLDEVTARIVELALPVFPTVPLAVKATAVADWPHEAVTGFLDVVGVVMPPLVYVQAARVDCNDVDALAAAADERQEALDEANTLDVDDGDEDYERFDFDPFTDDYVGQEDSASQVAYWRSAAAAAASHVGEVGRLRLAFAISGVLHEWTRGTDWYGEYETAQTEVATARRRRRVSPRSMVGLRTDRAAKEQEAHELYDELEPTVKAWVTQLLGAPRFVGGASRELRLVIAGDLVPEVNEWRRTKQFDFFTDPLGWARYRAALQVVGAAEEQLPAVKEQRVADLRSRASQVASELYNDQEFRSRQTKDEQKRYIQALVKERLWFRSADVTDRILAAARELISSGATRDRQGFSDA
jgi:hypothetical protein